MGIFLNPGAESFEKALSSDIYVDKSKMISFLNSVVGTNQNNICVSRPRRFGKTMAANMISAYYDRSIDACNLFRGLALAQTTEWDKYLNRFDVLRLNMLDFTPGKQSAGEVLEKFDKMLFKELKTAYADIEMDESDSLAMNMMRIYAKTRIRFVIIIDEWDCVFRQYPADAEGQKLYLDHLRDWLKDRDFVALAYMTGILPIKKYGQHSALNMFDEYAMISPKQLAEYAGFTDQEVKELCDSRNRHFETLKDWYDGYKLYGVIPGDMQKAHDLGEFRPKPISIYSPLSVVTTLRTGRLENYWNATETNAALQDYINHNYDGLGEDVAVLIKGGRIAVDITNYQNDMTTFHGKDDVLTLLIHLGYLGYDAERKEVFIPNKEIMEVFQSTTKDDHWQILFRTLERSQKLLEATWAGDASTVARLVEEAHQKTGNLTYNSEAALSYAIQLAYYSAQQYYTLIPEMQAGKGYADFVYIPSPKYSDKPVLLVELKWNKDVDTAMEQIHRNKYPDALEHYKGNMILVGINYDKEVYANDSEHYKHHNCVIERA